MNRVPPLTDIRFLLPEVLMTLLISTLLLIDPFLPRERKSRLGVYSVAGVLLVFLVTLFLRGADVLIFNQMLVVDNYATFFKIIFLLSLALTVLVSLQFLPIEGIDLGVYFVLLLCCTLGMMVMASGVDLISIYTGFELMSLSLYILAGFMKRDPRSGEASLKYFLLGAFTSAILLYGMALLYGITGTTNLLEMARLLSRGEVLPSPSFVLAMVLVIAGLGFKFAAVPFHMWVPDVFEGSPTSVAAFMSVAPKAAAIAVLGRVFMTAAILIKPEWESLLWILSVLTMTVGNITAVVQSSFKRMLAYSSIAHVGYILIGLIAARSEYGLAGLLFYLFVYAFMNIGAFSMIILLCGRERRGDQVSDFAGLARSSPLPALLLVIFFLSLVGIPPTAGFVGKFLLFSAAIEEKCVWLAIIGVVNSVVSLYYYFRVVRAMYMEDPTQTEGLSLSPGFVLALSVMGFAVVAIGIYPAPIINLAKASVMSMRSALIK